MPIANQIINRHVAAFVDWSPFYNQRNKIMSLKNMLIEASKSCPHLARLDEEKRNEMVNKAIQGFVLSLKQNNVIQLEPEKIVDNFMRYAAAN